MTEYMLQLGGSVIAACAAIAIAAWGKNKSGLARLRADTAHCKEFADAGADPELLAAYRRYLELRVRVRLHRDTRPRRSWEAFLLGLLCGGVSAVYVASGVVHSDYLLGSVGAAGVVASLFALTDGAMERFRVPGQGPGDQLLYTLARGRGGAVPDRWQIDQTFRQQLAELHQRLTPRADDTNVNETKQPGCPSTLAE